jgi:MYXO-CTERM domain-containing protein
VSNPQDPTPADPNGNPDNAADPDPEANGASTDAGGCQMSHGSTSGAAALLLGLVGAFGAARRRRRSG